jgi:hypothetical protein
MKKLMMAVCMGLMVCSNSVLAANKCQVLKEELKAMQQAQTQIMQSLVNNHEVFASSLEEYSAAVGVAPVKVTKEMNKSADAFRARGLQAKRIADKLNQATSDLIARVSQCL